MTNYNNLTYNIVLNEDLFLNIPALVMVYDTPNSSDTNSETANL